MKITAHSWLARACKNIPIFLCFLLPALTWASHFRIEDNFELTPGASYSGGIITEGSPFGGSYLAFSGPEFWFANGGIDVLPARTSDGDGPHAAARLAKISFDLINFEPGVESFNVTVNVHSGNVTDSFSFDIGAADITGGSANNFSFAVEFVVASRVGSDCCTDMGITYQQLSAGAWGIDNVVVDWGRVVPLPASAWLFLSALFGLLGIERVRTTKN